MTELKTLHRCVTVLKSATSSSDAIIRDCSALKVGFERSKESQSNSVMQLSRSCTPRSSNKSLVVLSLVPSFVPSVTFAKACISVRHLILLLKCLPQRAWSIEHSEMISAATKICAKPEARKRLLIADMKEICAWNGSWNRILDFCA